jgi:hypothetical protein
VWQDIINRSVPVVDFYFQTVIARLDLTTAKDKSEAVRELMPVLQDIGNRGRAGTLRAAIGPAHSC